MELIEKNEINVENINSSLDYDKMMDILNKTNIASWDEFISTKQIEAWLENFCGKALGDKDAEKKLALLLLMNFVFYTFNEVRAFCKIIFQDYMHLKLIEKKEELQSNGSKIQDEYNKIINDTLFLPLGNDSESGSNILYYFRQENGLSKKSFEIKSELSVKNLVFVDDVTLSGSQATNYIRSKNIKYENLYLLTFIATDVAIKNIKSVYPDINVLYATIIDDRSKCFNSLSITFKSSNTKGFLLAAKKMCEVYGKELVEEDKYMKDFPLGYDDGQYLFGFYYNTPDNSLPVLWFNKKGWKAIFKRYDKIYSNEGVKIHDGLYI